MGYLVVHRTADFPPLRRQWGPATRSGTEPPPLSTQRHRAARSISTATYTYCAQRLPSCGLGAPRRASGLPAALDYDDDSGYVGFTVDLTLAVLSAGGLNLDPIGELLRKLDLFSLSFALLAFLDAGVADIARTVSPERAVGVNAPP